MLRENHRGFRNMIFRHMTYSSGSLFFFCSRCRFCKIPLMSPPPSFRKKKRNLSLLLRLTPSPFCCSIFRVHSNTLFPSPALPSLQSHWPILWRTVKDRRSVYRLASFLGHWDNIDVCELPSHPPLSRTTLAPPPHTHTHSSCMSLQRFFRIGKGWVGRGHPTCFHICCYSYSKRLWSSGALHKFFEKKQPTRQSQLNYKTSLQHIYNRPCPWVTT